MKKVSIFIVLTIASATCYATDDLLCSGEKYRAYMSVGSDNIVDSATISDLTTNENIGFRLTEIKNIKLVWLDSESYDGNRLNIELMHKDGQKYKLTAKGVNGKLKIKNNTYNLSCDWER